MGRNRLGINVTQMCRHSDLSILVTHSPWHTLSIISAHLQQIDWRYGACTLGVMRTLTPSDALRLFLIASLGISPFACGGTTTPDGGDGDTGVGDGDGDTGDGDGDGVAETSTCTNPVPLVDSEDTGFVKCDEGYIHREKQVACSSVLPRDNQVEFPQSGFGGAINFVDECETDADCGDPLSYCVAESGGEINPARRCYDSCVTDSDCASGNVCLCGPEFGTCSPGIAEETPEGCVTDSDCTGDEMCVGVYYHGACGPGHYQFSCTPFSSPDFVGNAGGYEYECSMHEGAIACYPNVVCGRPFLIEQEDRKAMSVCRDEWCATRLASSDELPMSSDQTSHSEQAIAAQYFEKIALMEHASIAAFARFSLQLLSLGAPAQFIEETNQALVDETKHARLAFALASRFGGRNLGPGKLAIDGAMHANTPASILTTTILEGCVGETMAALEARAALQVCQDAEVRAVLEEIAGDEERHAALAWKVVKWMVEEQPELRALAESVFAQAVAERASTRGDGIGAPALGVLSARELSRVHADALDNVVIPCAAGLFKSSNQKAQQLSDSSDAVS